MCDVMCLTRFSAMRMRRAPKVAGPSPGTTVSRSRMAPEAVANEGGAPPPRPAGRSAAAPLAVTGRGAGGGGLLGLGPGGGPGGALAAK